MKRCTICGERIYLLGFDELDQYDPHVWTHGEKEDDEADHAARAER